MIKRVLIAAIALTVALGSIANLAVAQQATVTPKAQPIAKAAPVPKAIAPQTPKAVPQARPLVVTIDPTPIDNTDNEWVDADGTVHYSDRPVPGATQVYLPDATTPAPVPRPSQAASPGASSAATTTVPLGETAQYTQLAISSPAPQATLWNLGGVLTVDIVVGPRLQPGHRLGIIYDGALLNLNRFPKQLEI